MEWTNAAIIILLICFVVVCVLMGLVILMQRSKQEGLGAAFGGGFTESVWGAQTSQVLVKATVWLAAFFFILSIALARLYSHRDSMEKQISPLQQELLRPVAPATTPKTTAAAVPASPTPAAASTAAAVKPVTPAPTNTAPSQPAK